MTTTIKLSISDDVARALEAARGLYSRQEFIVIALVEKLTAQRPPEPERPPDPPADDERIGF